MKNNPLLILDFGSQYTQLIARQVREMGVYCEIYPYDLDEKKASALSPCGVVLSGGPSTVTLENNPCAPDWVFTCAKPVLGICYGMQTMAVQLGGTVVSSFVSEFGHARVRLLKDSALWSSLDAKELDVWMSHGDQVSALPPGFVSLCDTTDTAIAGMADEKNHWYALQFHPEVTHTPQGQAILSHFVLDICHALPQWTASFIAEQTIQDIRAQVGSDGVLLGLSGGVDSSVVAALLQQAIGHQLICVFVDTGLLRLHEVEQVVAMFQQDLDVHLIVVDAKARFLKALDGISCPEEKRKVIGRTFIDVFEHEAQKIPHVAWLAQGTIYPDVIESAACSHGATAVIKSHHNVGGLPDTMKLKLLEPIRKLFKDEVRKLGLELGLPYDMVYRHPFPGPGLAVRILGEIQPLYVDILQKADAIYIEELRRANLYHKVSQAFAVFLPVKSVGVTGDNRRYAYVICLRAVETTDFMTAHWAHLPWDFLGHVSNRIINEVQDISRVTYDISGKPPATIEWE